MRPSYAARVPQIADPSPLWPGQYQQAREMLLRACPGACSSRWSLDAARTARGLPLVSAWDDDPDA
jgi:hypothetical protein